MILIGNSKTLIDKRSHFDKVFNYTELFRKLVQLSKKESIGNFVNVADLYDSPLANNRKAKFQSAPLSHKVGDIIKGTVSRIGISKATGNKYGVFIDIAGQFGLAPYFHENKILNKDFTSYGKGDTVTVLITEINEKDNKITLKILNPVLVKLLKLRGHKFKSQITKILPNGLIIKTNDGIVGLANINPGLINQYKIGQKIDVILVSVNLENEKVKFKLA